MTPAQALADIRGYASANRIRISGHARERMVERGVTYGDLRRALANATRCTTGDRGRWRVEGPDLDGDKVTAAVVLEGGVIVVTVF